MKPFADLCASDSQSALETLPREPAVKLIAGGTNPAGLVKENSKRPTRLVDTTRLVPGVISISRDGGVRLPAVATNAATANHPLVQARFPLLARAIFEGASAALRNVATNGGSLMQRPRCHCFYDAHEPCNKRDPGSGCGALNGFNHTHAILGASAQCVGTHPSDMCVALAALDAVVEVEGTNGTRNIPIRNFHRLPGSTPQRDTNLGRDELVVAIALPGRSAVFAAHSCYLKARDRASFESDPVSVAAALALDGDRIRRVRICLGGVAHKPWPAQEAESVLTGALATEENFRIAAEAAVRQAQPRKHNAFKVELAKTTIVRALSAAAAGTN
jgi:xanthine dehydrogenase YagS FAD-binding subunit